MGVGVGVGGEGVGLCVLEVKGCSLNLIHLALDQPTNQDASHAHFYFQCGWQQIAIKRQQCTVSGLQHM